MAASVASTEPVVARSAIISHIVRQADETRIGDWDGFTLRSAFQPIFAFAANGKLEIVAFEGLLRPFRKGVALSPPDFFAQIRTADRMNVETLSRTLHLLNAGRFLDPAASIFVNFDPSVFTDHVLTDQVLRDLRLVLHEAGLDYGRVVCEVTEQRSVSEAALYNLVGELREHGFRIAVDDYGAEDSDMNRIAALRPDIVKFDARWTNQLMNTGPGVGLLSAMVTTFRDFGIETVFEGIEHGWQLELAQAAGASMVQGYAIARPELAPTRFGDGRWTVRDSASASDLTDHSRPNGGHADAAPVFGKRGVHSRG